jgi:hypothetical protein
MLAASLTTALATSCPTSTPATDSFKNLVLPVGWKNGTVVVPGWWACLGHCKTRDRCDVSSSSPATWRPLKTF